MEVHLLLAVSLLGAVGSKKVNPIFSQKALLIFNLKTNIVLFLLHPGWAYNQGADMPLEGLHMLASCGRYGLPPTLSPGVDFWDLLSYYYNKN